MKKLFVFLSIALSFLSHSAHSITTQSRIQYYQVVNVNTSDVLNIRQSSDPRSKEMGQIPPNEKCVAYLNKAHRNESGRKWLKIHYKGITGWANSRYLKQSEQCEHRLITQYYQLVQVNSHLNIRELHNRGSRKVGKIPPKAKCVAYLNESYPNKSNPKWRRINYKGINGWVNSSYLKDNKACPASYDASVPSMDSNIPSDEKSTLDKLAREKAELYDLDPALVCAIINQESRWDPNAVSPKGAVGLMQIMPSTGKEACGLNEEELYDPGENINCGVSYFTKLLNRFGSEKLALCAYNAGPHRVVKWNGCPNFKETNRYTRNILGAWKGGKSCPQMSRSSSIKPTKSKATQVTASASIKPTKSKATQAHLSAIGIADYLFLAGKYPQRHWWTLVCQATDFVYDREIGKRQLEAVGQAANTPFQQQIWWQILDSTVDNIHTDEVRLEGKNKALSQSEIKDKIITACPLGRRQ
ncbi:MAG: transglycosylase SLT domain-containing protein [Candidatus Parabeggiatoa sp.]|nr:transglycosylase SLT domain-containing protein [Candidatus Parabeggiatoa sp.]